MIWIIELGLIGAAILAAIVVLVRDGRTLDAFSTGLFLLGVATLATIWYLEDGQYSDGPGYVALFVLSGACFVAGTVVWYVESRQSAVDRSEKMGD